MRAAGRLSFRAYVHAVGGVLFNMFSRRIWLMTFIGSLNPCWIYFCFSCLKVINWLSMWRKTFTRLSIKYIVVMKLNLLWIHLNFMSSIICLIWEVFIWLLLEATRGAPPTRRPLARPGTIRHTNSTIDNLKLLIVNITVDPVRVWGCLILSILALYCICISLLFFLLSVDHTHSYITADMFLPYVSKRWFSTR